MKSLLFTIILLLSFIAQSQTTSPWIDEMTSISGIGDKFRLVTGQGNTGSHAGEMCYNVSGTYLDDNFYSFESETLDLTAWAEVSVEFTIASNLRNNDQFAFYYFDDATSSWSGFDLSGLTGTYTVTIPTTSSMISFDLSTFSNGNLNGKYAHVDRIVLSDPASPLPVELVTFVAELKNDINVIEWSTASEWNSDYFNVEWSDDTENWRTISTTPAAGYSNQLIHYVYYDCFPQPIINYYRLVQFDFDGESETFGPIVVDNRKQEKRILRYVSLSGQEIDPTSTTGLVIGIFEDGTTVKVYL